jgi:hypothetical protein
MRSLSQLWTRCLPNTTSLRWLANTARNGVHVSPAVSSEKAGSLMPQLMLRPTNRAPPVPEILSCIITFPQSWSGSFVPFQQAPFALPPHVCPDNCCRQAWHSAKIDRPVGRGLVQNRYCFKCVPVAFLLGFPIEPIQSTTVPQHPERQDRQQRHWV